jgi:hypothetical protein
MFSDMNCHVFVNGIRFTEWNKSSNMTRHLEKDDVAFADVYVRKNCALFA